MDLGPELTNEEAMLMAQSRLEQDHTVDGCVSTPPESDANIDHESMAEKAKRYGGAIVAVVRVAFTGQH